jgi:beta-N-acetylhexosaminidase
VARGVGWAPAEPTRPELLAPEVAALQVLAVGEEAGEEAATDELVAQGLGAVVLFASALRDPARAAARAGTLLAASLRSPARSPLLLAADQEGGRVVRLPVGPTTMPGAAALGATGRPELARAAARATAGQLRAVGVSWDLAPVADLADADNPALRGRCFAGDPETAAAFVAAFVEGLRDGGVASCAKHFPGHGATPVDSHRALPTVEVDLPTLRARAWVPFAAAVRAGADAVMVGHLRVPALGPGPASLEPAAYAALRQALGFEGVAVTDSLDMAACRAAAGGVGPAAVRALAAGADLVLVGHGPREHREAWSALTRAIADGTVPPARVREAIARVHRLKEALGLGRRPLPDPEGAAHLLARPSDARLAREIATRAILEPASGPARPRVASILAGGRAPRALVEAARARWPEAEVLPGAAASPWVSLDGLCHLGLAPTPTPPPPGRALLAWDATPASLEALLDAAEGRR